MNDNQEPFLTLPRLGDVPRLIHGFGDAGWSEADFLAYAALRGVRPIIMRQLHSDIIHRVDEVPPKELEGDALMTDVPGLLLVIRTADCLPVFLVDGANGAVAAVHCGWRGTEKRILEKSVRAMSEAYGSKPAEMLAAFGPCIGASCYEVGPEVREGFLRAGFPASIFSGTERALQERSRPAGGTVTRGDSPLQKALLDLRAANGYLIEKAGIRKANWLGSGDACTHCEPSFLSFRRDPANRRRMHNFVGFLLSV